MFTNVYKYNFMLSMLVHILLLPFFFNVINYHNVQFTNVLCLLRLIKQ